MELLGSPSVNVNREVILPPFLRGQATRIWVCSYRQGRGTYYHSVAARSARRTGRIGHRFASRSFSRGTRSRQEMEPPPRWPKGKKRILHGHAMEGDGLPDHRWCSEELRAGPRLGRADLRDPPAMDPRWRCPHAWAARN